MLGRYVKAQLMVLLCGGLVGPIFLGVYFALGQDADSSSGCSGWVCSITAADVLIALALASYGAKSAAKTQMLEANGVLALAQVTGIGETGTRINDQPLVKIDLHIEGPGHHAVRRPGPGDRVGDAAADDHRPQTGRARRSRHQRVPNRLEAKRFGGRHDASAVHASPRTTGPTTCPGRRAR